MKKYFEVADNSYGATHVALSIYHFDGGYDYFAHKDEPRGIYISVQPCVYAEHEINGVVYTQEQYVAWSGVKCLVEPLKRKNAKRLQSHIERLEPRCCELIELFLKNQRDAMLDIIWEVMQ